MKKKSLYAFFLFALIAAQANSYCLETGSDSDTKWCYQDVCNSSSQAGAKKCIGNTCSGCCPTC